MTTFSNVLKDREEDFDPGLEEITSMCQTCVHRDKETPVVCEAFPDGIPLAIMLGVFDHTHLYDVGGVSDNGVTWYPAEEENNPLTNPADNGILKE